MFASIGAWILLKLLNAWAHAAEASAAVFFQHKTAVLFAVIFGLALALSGSNTDRYLIVAAMIASYFLGIRYPL